MSQLVKESQLRELMLALWEKTKEKTDGAFKNASYNQLTQEVVFTKENGQTITLALSDLVSKTNENVITGKTLLIDGYIRGGVHSTLVNSRSNLSVVTDNGAYFTTTSLSVDANAKISTIVLTVDSNLQVGDTVTGVNLGAIRKRERTVLPYLIQNGTATVKENTFKDVLPGTRVIEVPVNKSWSEDVLLLVGARGMTWGERPLGVNYYVKGGHSLPTVGTELSLNTANWHGSCIVFSEQTSLNDLPTEQSNNTWSGQNFIMNGYVMGGVIAKVDNKTPNLQIARGNHYMGLKSAQLIPSQTLSSITIAIHEGVAVGTRIDGIKVGAIRVRDDVLTHYVVNNTSAVVQENLNPELSNCTKCVVVKLDAPFTPTEHYWFCITCDRLAWGERSIDIATLGCTANTPMPNVGATVGTKVNGYMGKYLLHADKISLNNLASMARRLVRSVNGQVPNDQGEVVIGVDHIENLHDLLASKLDSSEVALEANKIPRLDSNGKLPSSVLPQVEVTTVHTVNSRAEALQKVVDGTCRPADIVIIETENNAVYICKSSTGATFNDNFIRLSIADGTVKMVNNQTPNAQGQVVLNASHFSDIYSKTESDGKYLAYTYEQIDNANDFKESKIARTKASTTNLPTGSNSNWGVIQFFKENTDTGLQMWHSTDGHTKGQVWTRTIANNTWSQWKRVVVTDDLNGMIKSVNGQTPNNQGQVTLTGSVNHSNGNITINVGNVQFATLECMNESDVNEIKNLFV